MRFAVRMVAAAIAALLCSTSADADVTAFIGATSDPGTRNTKGLAVGAGLVIVGFEFEYADAGGDEDDDPGCSPIAPPGSDECKPSLRTGMGNLLLQTPRGIAPIQVYGTVGAGVYRQQVAINDETDTGFGTNLGGGVKIELVGPLRLRLDYRVFRLTGDTEFKTPKRFYAGANLSF